jgi:antitoxin MazE
MKTKVQKWGNSLAIRIPKSFATEIGLQKEAPVDISFNDGKLVISPLSDTLDEVLNRITEKNLHREVDTGSAAGNELW